MKTLFHCIAAAGLTLLLTSCASPPAPVGFFDFGALPKSVGTATACVLPPVQVADISSPAALDSNLIVYRLLYASDIQSHAYANHRWSMTPAQLLGLRIKSRLAASQVQLIDAGVANPHGWQLRMELIDFSQAFSDASHSTAQLALRASLLRNNSLIAQTTLMQQAAAETADAPGGALAMRNASDALITDLNDWLCKQSRP